MPGSNGRMHGLARETGGEPGLRPGLDLPARVVRNVHRGVTADTGERRQPVAGEGFAARDAFVFARAAGDDVRATTSGPAATCRHRACRSSRRSYSRGVGQDAGAVDIVLRPRVDAQRLTAR